MNKIKIIIWGFGAMGRGMAEMLLQKKGIEIVGVCDINPDYIDVDIQEILRVKANHPKVKVTNNIDQLLNTKKADVVLLATDSFVEGAYDKIVKVITAKINCISTAEEMAYPKANHPVMASQIDQLAKAYGVTVLGTGINPGFIMDLLVVALSGTMTDVKHIEAKRVNSLSPFGPAVMHEQGVGISLDEYNFRIAENNLAGHVGFKESVHMISDALGIKIEGFKQQMEPIITNVDRKSKYGEAKAGTLAGINMTGQGLVGGNVFIDMIHPQQIEPELEGIQTGDYISLTGTPNIHMAINPEVEGGIGTIAMCVNMIPHVINARAGLKTMIDLPVPRAILGDMRDLIEQDV
ncbi:MAG: 2,4-diaminopentanoate dehydrogenase [Acholeplasmataceae bacterium]|jgi:4-hydroxy-tetrahydrodipicolinate reductase|nr:2,4-diaminopentanoate dehydrogenase [Acholeplasmataceae bacterium]